MWLHIAVGFLWGLGVGAWLWRRSASLSDHLSEHYEL